jgi:hypothetical protein
MASIYTTDQATDTLTAEGFDQHDVMTAIHSMVTNTALELVQPDEGWVFSDDELGVLRDQCAQWREARDDLDTTFDA